MQPFTSAVALLALVACTSSPSSTVDQCHAVGADWRAAAASLSRSCQGPADCAVIGGAAPCGGSAGLSQDCGGDVVASRALASANLGPLEARWADLDCATVLAGEAAFDCPGNAAECVGGQCVPVARCECLCGLNPDAGPADGGPPDASTVAASL